MNIFIDLDRAHGIQTRIEHETFESGKEPHFIIHLSVVSRGRLELRVVHNRAKALAEMFHTTADELESFASRRFSEPS